MKRLFVFTALTFLIVWTVSCGSDNNSGKEYGDMDGINTPDDSSDAGTEVSDDDSVDTAPDDEGGCAVFSSDENWMAPDNSWESWIYLKMMGKVGEYGGNSENAYFTEGKVKLAETTKDFIKGSFSNSVGKTILGRAVFYQLINVDQSVGTATMDYWELLYEFPSGLISDLKNSGKNGTDYGAIVTITNSQMDIELSETGAIIAQHLRKVCYPAVSVTEKRGVDGEPENVPVGGITGCFEDNTDALPGETLKMIFKNRLTEDKTAIELFLNTRPDGTLIKPDENGFIPQCQCYEPDGVTKTECE